MFFTRTIRRKLVVTLVLLLVVLATLTYSGVTGLRSYRFVVAEFDRILNRTPHKEHLAEGIALMFEPLRAVPPVMPVEKPDAPHQARSGKIWSDWSARQQQEFSKARIEANTRKDQFLLRMEGLSPAELHYAQRVVIGSLVGQIEERLRQLRLLEPNLRDPRTHDAAVVEMLGIISDMQVIAHKIPDHAEQIEATVIQARKESKDKLVIVYFGAAVALVALTGLIRFAYVSIFDPLQRLHQGALRVAHGDVHYRLKLTTRDEMADLAEAFNAMNDRYREINGDLDRQVHERSQQLVRSERLANVGVLSAGVAHEINNPLSAISMASESIADRIEPVLKQMEAGEAGVIRQYLQMIQDESVRCRNITERLLDFSRGRDNVREQTDLTRLVQDVINVVQHLGKFRGKNITFKPHAPCFAEINSAEIKQVILNLVANGLEAMDRGGTLTVQISEQTDHVRIQFDDEGCGMTPDVLERIFEPFFTQKQTGQGTGLGLSITHRIVHQHGGSIDVRSPGPGQGSTFCVRLPRRAARRGAA